MTPQERRDHGFAFGSRDNPFGFLSKRAKTAPAGPASPVPLFSIGDVVRTPDGVLADVVDMFWDGEWAAVTSDGVVWRTDRLVPVRRNPRRRR